MKWRRISEKEVLPVEAIKWWMCQSEEDEGRRYYRKNELISYFYFHIFVAYYGAI
jgi:hypothetical protein